MSDNTSGFLRFYYIKLSFVLLHPSSSFMVALILKAGKENKKTL